MGYAYPERLNGLFGPDNWKLGLTLAVLSPVAWEYVSRVGTGRQLALAWLTTAIVVLLASNRQSWVVFALAAVLWGWRYAHSRGLRPLRMLVPAFAIVALAGAAAYQFNPKFALQVDKTLLAERLTYESLNDASSGRLRIWENATRAFLDHPVNGVGARSYRYVYAEHAEPDDPYISPDGIGVIYAHQLVLEMGSETGLIGLAGLATLFLIFVWSNRKAVNDPLAWPAWLGVVVWLFPLNAHTAIYFAYWSLLIGC